jgi:TonB family protein
MSEVWAQWEGRVINGEFPLQRFLGGSDRSGVFLTEFAARDLPRAALKLIPAIPTLKEMQLAHWATAAALHHPHLIQLLESGRCQLGGLEFLFVVMPYAEQTLSQILPRRALTPDEVRDMLHPLLDTLAFLHDRHLVHGQLKPANILVVDDQLKLASDSIRPAGDAAAGIASPSLYDPPEAVEGGFSAAGDIWSLGMTLIEALTQQAPTGSLPHTVSTMFASMVRQCVNPNPALRPTVADLQAQLDPVPIPPVPAPTVLAQPMAARPAAARPAAARPVPAISALDLSGAPRKWRALGAALAVVLAATLAAWAGLHGIRTSQNPPMPSAELPAAAAPSSTDTAPPQLVNDAPSVLHEEIPVVSPGARGTVHGRIKVAVRVTVDGSGRVTDAALENSGPSKYFARLATNAAKKWKFSAPGQQDSRKWLLTFEFTRAGATGHASALRS